MTAYLSLAHWDILKSRHLHFRWRSQQHTGVLSPQICKVSFYGLEGWMLFPGYFPACWDTELRESQFGNSHCLHQAVQSLQVVPTWRSLPKNLLWQVARRCPFPGNVGGTCTRQSLSIPLLSSTHLAPWVAKNPKRWVPRPYSPYTCYSPAPLSQRPQQKLCLCAHLQLSA